MGVGAFKGLHAGLRTVQPLAVFLAKLFDYLKGRPMAAGRPRKPSKKHNLEGTAPRDGRRGNPVIANGQPEKPDWLTGEASEMWDKVLPEVVRVAGAASIDSFALAAMCDWWGAYRKYRADCVNKWAPARARDAFNSWQRLAARFGLTPLDRQSLQIELMPKDGKAKKFGIVG